MSFPLNPTNGQQYTTSLGTIYQYVSLDNKWILVNQEILGNQGVTGIQGQTGAQGAQGVTGATGTQGTQGQTGAQGFTGLGVTGIFYTGAQGLTGAQGIQGTQGATGVQGTQGTQGVTGATGTQGTQGVTGATGTQGTQGVTGATGTQGTQGVTGATGTAGSAGAAGADSGATGVINIIYNNGVNNPIAPFTGLIGEFEMPFRFKVYGWDTWAADGSTGWLRTTVFNQTYANYTNKMGDTSMSGLTGPYLNGMLKNTQVTTVWPGPTGTGGDIVSVWANYVTGLYHLTLALKYNKY